MENHQIQIPVYIIHFPILRAYHTGMTCMEAWIQRCLPTDGQKILQQQIGGARALMRFLCSNGTTLRKGNKIKLRE